MTADKKPDDGGPAFGQVVELRCVRVDMDGSEEYEPALSESGMRLRDYFAAKVFVVAYKVTGPSVKGWDRVADVAYAIADAMIQARKS